MIPLRQREGIAAAKQRGVYNDRKLALTAERARELCERAAVQAPSVADMHFADVGRGGRGADGGEVSGLPGTGPVHGPGSGGPHPVAAAGLVAGGGR